MERETLQSPRTQDTAHSRTQSLLLIRTSDIFGRPAVVIRPSAIQNKIPDTKKEILRVYEAVRQQMAFRHHFQESGSLQFVMIIDCKGASFNGSVSQRYFFNLYRYQSR